MNAPNTSKAAKLAPPTASDLATLRERLERAFGGSRRGVAKPRPTHLAASAERDGEGQP